MNVELQTLTAEGLRQFQALRADAVSAVTERFYATHGSTLHRFGPRGREATREDLAFHLEFLRPVLEFGLPQPMVDYLIWLASVLRARDVPAEHLPQSLDWLAEFFAGRMGGADGAVVVAALKAARMSFLEAGTAPQAPFESPVPWVEAAEFEAALLAGNQREALAIVSRCIDSAQTLLDVELHVIQPALYRIGAKWQANQVSVAQEHLATAIAQSVMTVGLLQSPAPSPIDKRVLLACVEGNNHAVGLRMVADAFLLAGWDVQYLGANVPTCALVTHAAEWKPDLVGLSVSFAQQLPAVRAVIAALIERLGDARPAVMIGGLAINRFDRLAAMVGADGCSADARAAVCDADGIVNAAGTL
ncbi:MAG: cobalamin-dependent protein [Propionivibrio sp.]|nr:cobalamin-dependent protein [Propionivibrio sp.]